MNGTATKGSGMDRGVYTAGYRSPDGHEVLIGVTRDGRKVVEVVVTDPEERTRFINRTWMLMNVADPKAELRAL